MNAATQELWSAWSAGRLCFQTCDSCGHTQHPPGPVCSTCHATGLSLADVSGDAELVAWSTVHRAPSAAFAEQIPYTVVLVRIAEGALVEARADDPNSDAEQWAAGQPARLTLGMLNGTALPIARVGQ